MTELELLREAARVMRETAYATEQSPWTAEVGNEGQAWINLPAYRHAWGMHGFGEEAAHVASWHPAVALAVADWLDAEATHHESVVALADAATAGDEWVVRLSASTLPQAVAVARAYLGGAS